MSFCKATKSTFPIPDSRFPIPDSLENVYGGLHNYQVRLNH
ncbi:hypothetical protein [Moorena producens]|nr:hypothetical protein [Moorena producens]